MAFSKPMKAELSSLTEVDRFSNLPLGLKENILTYLPIKEAGRTSILSQKWRYTWAFIPELVISDLELNSKLSHRSSEEANLEIIRYVDSIFLLHRGPIRSCVLVIHESCYEAYDRWIMHLTRNGIREFMAKFCHSGDYKIHSSFFSCDALNYINVNYCLFKLPLHFKGFKLLKAIEFGFVTISDEDIEKLVSSTPLLEKLALVDMSFTFLNIRAPNLDYLDIECRFADLRICAPKLTILYADKLDLLIVQNYNSAQLLANKPDLENLVLKGNILSYFHAKPSDQWFSCTFNNLKNLELRMEFEKEKESRFVLGLFRRAPRLESLQIQVDLVEEGPLQTFWDKIDGKDDLFRNLETVELVNFRAVATTILFVKFVLGCAPRIESLTIEEDLNYKDENASMFEEFISFPKASPKAQIIFE